MASSLGSTHQGNQPAGGRWITFAAMIATSIVTMFVLKYSNVYAADHVFFSQTRMWMALMMGMAMIVIMLGFMWGMYGGRRTKIAVLIFRRAQLSDPRMRRLADDIIEAQVKEIAQMKLLIADIEKNGETGDGTPLPPRTAAMTPELMRQAAKGAERR